VNGRSFASERARILRSGRPARTIRKALAHLAREAGAAPVVVDGRVVAHQMPSGVIVCTLRRYPTERAVIHELDGVRAFAPVNGDRKVPVRHFFCPRCRGYHVTAQA